MPAQRIRVWFRKGERVRYISHLDVLRFWERAIRRAGLPLSYSQGFTPHPKLAFAGPLPLGFVSEAEIMDVTLDERVPVGEFRARLAQESPEDLAVVDAAEMPLSAPSPQASAAWAEYRLDLVGVDPGGAAATVRDFVAATDVPWTEERREKPRTYNLRDVVAILVAEPQDGGTRLTMRLRADQEATGRPEQVVAALFPAAKMSVITRTRLVLNETSPAHELWRKKGRFE